MSHYIPNMVPDIFRAIMQMTKEQVADRNRLSRV
jgi:hypothetical protein